MKNIFQRKSELSKVEIFIEKLRQFAYFETILITCSYLFLGYMIDPDDICITQGSFSYMLVLLAVITLFHGFEKGMVAIAILAFGMYWGYEEFLYVDFLITLMMTLIFSEFHYYWNRQIQEAKTKSHYYELKLGELSKAFYTLKISHDQLEKNYVIKPMSLRNSLRLIRESKSQNKYEDFLTLLATSFHVSVAQIAYKEGEGEEFEVVKQNKKECSVNFDDLLIKEVLKKSKPIYISDYANTKSDYIAVIPAFYMNEITALLLIEKIPFMSFNQENLTSVAILFQYFINEMRKEILLHDEKTLLMIEDEDFRYEYCRLFHIYKLYKIDSVSFVIKTEDLLLSERLYVTAQNLLRSLDMVVRIEHEKCHFLLFLFPFAQRSSAEGFLKRLLRTLKNVKHSDIESMAFSFEKKDLLEQYVSYCGESDDGK